MTSKLFHGFGSFFVSKLDNPAMNDILKYTRKHWLGFLILLLSGLVAWVL